MARFQEDINDKYYVFILISCYQALTLLGSTGKCILEITSFIINYSWR